MKIKSLAATATLTLASFGAFAGNSAFWNRVVNFASDSGLPKDDSFTQTINFYGLTDGLYGVFEVNGGTNLFFSTITLDTNPWTIGNMTTSYDGVTYAFEPLEVINENPITLTLSEYSSASANSSGILAGTTPPESENYVMLLGGLGLMGAIALRRKNRTES